MAKKTLKKSKKIEATKPLMVGANLARSAKARFIMVRSAPKGTTRPEKRISNSKRAAADEATALFET